MAQLSKRFDTIENSLDEMQEYSYAFKINPRENAVETNELCVKLFREMGADVSINDIDIAHRVSPRDKTRRGPKPIVCESLAVWQRML